jgi:hypothetical protein
MISISSYRYFTSNLPDDLIKLIEAYCDPETDFHRDKIIQILKTVNVTRNGFQFINCENQFENKKTIKNIIDCTNQIPSIIRPLKTAYSVGSYGGKHVVEKYRKDVLKLSGDCYICNGEFIIAMLLLGYKLKYSNGLNFCFRAGYI